jgi:uncharacterized membrane protein
MIQKLMRRLKGMTDPAYRVLRAGVAVSCIMLVAALLLLIAAEDPAGDTYALRRLAEELYSLPAGVLLIASIVSVCVEERFMK